MSCVADDLSAAAAGRVSRRVSRKVFPMAGNYSACRTPRAKVLAARAN
jgi:hypothetical protein